MYVVTNRRIERDKKGLAMFGKTPSVDGPNTLRLFKIDKTAKTWKIELLEDKLTKGEVKNIASEFSLKDFDTSEPQYASFSVAADIIRRARKQKRNVLFFVHGFNNNMEAVLERALNLEKRFGLQVIPFSWPANGGGVPGVLSYKSDKRDAKASVGALDRALAKMHDYLRLFTDSTRQSCWEKADKEFPDNPERRDARYAELIEKSCPFTANLMVHSMGNYLYKHLLLSTASEGTALSFDNVILVAADANTKGHKTWVDRIESRVRTYVTINENDTALAASRAKSGQDQLARLGHFLGDLDSRRALYINFTDASWVRSSHAYFEGMSLKNRAVEEFFDDTFNGKRAERGLNYEASGNYYDFL
jgi:esterase/lipase superfamily enzyme